MIYSDPTLIVCTLMDEIRKLEEASALSRIVPDPEYGYTSDIVYGFLDNEVAAVHFHTMATGEEAVWFQLKTGKIVRGDRTVCAVH